MKISANVATNSARAFCHAFSTLPSLVTSSIRLRPRGRTSPG
jgi:hypothetical protein